MLLAISKPLVQMVCLRYFTRNYGMLLEANWWQKFYTCSTATSCQKGNDTIIALIPKTDKPERVTDLRPISLCNVTYKVVSKVLAGRLRTVLDDVNSPSQSAFVLGHLIFDNILVAYEITHLLLNKRDGNLSYAAVKLDMSKVYDRVEWCFLEKMVRRLGFADQWIGLIMECVSTVSYKDQGEWGPH